MQIVEISKTKENRNNIISATFLVDGELRPLKVSSGDNSVTYNKVEALITSGRPAREIAEQLYQLMMPIGRVEEAISSSRSLGGNLVVRDGSVYFNNFKLEETLASHMLSLLDSQDTPKDERLWKSYVRFLDNLHQNVDEDIRNQLFKWLQYENNDGHSFAITDDGCIVGYKGCIGDVLSPRSQFEGVAYVDGEKHVGQIPNPVGSVISMPRSAVQVDPSVGCSVGLHVGTYNYASNWAPILLLVKVNPRDIVSVPYEVDSQKMRVCEYTVLEVTEGPLANLYYELSDGFDLWDDEEFEEKAKEAQAEKEMKKAKASEDDRAAAEDLFNEFSHRRVDIVYESTFGPKLVTGFIESIYYDTRIGFIVRTEDEGYKHIKQDKLYSVNEVLSQEEINDILEEINRAEFKDEVRIQVQGNNEFHKQTAIFISRNEDAIVVKDYEDRIVEISLDTILFFEFV